MKTILSPILLLLCVLFVNGLSYKCDYLPSGHLRVYERRACNPIIVPGCKYPVYYNCSAQVITPPLQEAEVRKLEALGENACIFDGKVLAYEEDLDMPCQPCHCMLKTTRNVSGHMIRGSAFGLCLHDDCWDEDHEKLQKGCHSTYFSDVCEQCPTGRICAGHEKANFRCMVDGKTYRYGERIRKIGKDPCKTCLCDEKFNVDDLEQSNCWQEGCYPVKYDYKVDTMSGNDEDAVLMQHCTPIYDRTRCCHMDFICGKDFNPNAGSFKDRPTNLNDTCVLNGESYKIDQKKPFKPEDTFLKFDKQKNGECTCRIPPLMTCYYD